MTRLLAIALAGLLCNGCFVLEELNKGEAILETHSPTARRQAAEAKKREAEMAANPKGKDTPTAQERAQAWWGKAQVLAPGSMNSISGIARCQIAGRVQFLSKSDCQLRGGRILGG